MYEEVSSGCSSSRLGWLAGWLAAGSPEWKVVVAVVVVVVAAACGGWPHENGLQERDARLGPRSRDRISQHSAGALLGWE